MGIVFVKIIYYLVRVEVPVGVGFLETRVWQFVCVFLIAFQFSVCVLVLVLVWVSVSPQVVDFFV